MDSLFNEIYNDIITEENIIEDTCNICHFKTTKNKIKLKCGHIFHKKCIKKCINNTISKISNCPYCNKIIIKEDIVKITENIKKVKDNKNNKVEGNICKKILKSGKNKGKECGRTNCHYHNNNNIII